MVYVSDILGEMRSVKRNADYLCVAFAMVSDIVLSLSSGRLHISVRISDSER